MNTNKLYDNKKKEIKNYEDINTNLFKLLIDLKQLFLVDEICCEESGEGYIKENRYLKRADKDGQFELYNKIRILSVLSKSINNLIGLLNMEISQNKNIDKIYMCLSMIFRKLKYSINELFVMYENILNTLLAYGLIEKNTDNNNCIVNDFDHNYNTNLYDIQRESKYQNIVDCFNNELYLLDRKYLIYKISYIKQKMDKKTLKENLTDIILKIERCESLKFIEIITIQNALRNLHSHKTITEYTGSSNKEFNNKFYEISFNFLLNTNLKIIQITIEELSNRYIFTSWLNDNNLKSFLKDWSSENNLQSFLPMYKIDFIFLLLTVKYCICFKTNTIKEKILRYFTKQFKECFIYFNKNLIHKSGEHFLEEVFKENSLKFDNMIKSLVNYLNNNFYNQINYHYKQIGNKDCIDKITKLSEITGEDYIEVLSNEIKYNKFVDIDSIVNSIYHRVKMSISLNEFLSFTDSLSEVYRLLLKHKSDINYQRISSFDDFTIEQVSEFEQVPIEKLIYDYVIWYQLSENNKKIGKEFVFNNLVDTENYLFIKNEAIKKGKDLFSKTYVETIEDKLFNHNKSLDKYNCLLLSYFFYDVYNLQN